MPRSNSTVLSGSSSSASGSASRRPLPFTRSVTDFAVERTEKPSPKPLSYSRPPSRNVESRSGLEFGTEALYKQSVSVLLNARAHPFSISGHFPVDPKSLTVFFRSQSGITHALDFPIDVEVEAPSELDVLIAACKPHATCELDGFSDRESLFYPPNLPLTSTLELASHPIMDAIRTSLFPNLTAGQHLVAVRDVMQLVPTGGHMCPQRRLTQEEGKVAKLIITLPVRFKGGALTVHDFDGNQEKYYGRGGKPGDLEWTAFLGDCDHEVETVSRGVRLTISYNILLRTFGPSPNPAQSLIIPSDRFLDLISPILNLSRGLHVAFYLREQYGFSPSDVLAETLVPHLKGGDALLYHSLRLYKLSPELRWAAGGYIWPVDSAVDCGSFVRGIPQIPATHQRSPSLVGHPAYPISPSGRHRRAYSGVPRNAFTMYHGSHSDSTEEDDLEEAGTLRDRVEDSGASLISQEGIHVLTEDVIGRNDDSNTVTKERVPYVSGGNLDRLVINVLLVVYVP